MKSYSIAYLFDKICCLSPIIIFSVMVFAIIVWGVLGYFFSKEKFFVKTNAVLFFAYMLLVFLITVFNRNVYENNLILQPFHNIIIAFKDPSIFSSEVLNLLLFFPFGLFLPFALVKNGYQPVCYAVTIGFLLSVCVEVLQLAFCVGYCETDDVIVNTVGTFLGCLAYIVSRAIRKKRHSH